MNASVKRLLLPLAFGWLVAILPRAALAQGPIPPGREAFVSEMLGMDPSNRSGCSFAGALIESDQIKARYQCSGMSQTVVLSLRHPEASQGAIARTERFSIHNEAATPPAGLVESLADRVRTKESTWLWGDSAQRPVQTKSANVQPGSPPAASSKTPRPWLVVCAALLWVASRRKAPSLPQADLWVAGALCLAALLARVGLGAWGPFHMNGQGPFWVMGAAWDPAGLAQYGPGYAELYSALTAVFPRRPDDAIFAANACLSATVPALAYGAARLGGMDRVRACLAGALLVVDPVSLRLAATESYLVPIIALSAAASLLLMAASSEGVAGRVLQAAGLAGCGALLCAQAIRIHPYGWAPAALCAFSSIAVHRDRGMGRRLAWTGAMLGGCGASVLAVNGSMLRKVGEHSLQEGARMGVLGIRWNSIVDGPVVWMAVGLAIGLFVARPRWLIAPAIAALAALAFTHHMHSQSWLQHVAIQRLFAPMIVVGLVAAIPHAWMHNRAVRVAALSAAIALLVSFLPLVRGRTTEHLEYRWLRPRLASIPSTCTLAYVPRAAKRVLYLPEYAARARSSAQRLTVEVASGGALLNTFLAGQCTYLLHSSLCASASGRPRCEELEHGVSLELVDRAAFPAMATHDDEPFDRDSVEVILWRVLPER